MQLELGMTQYKITQLRDQHMEETSVFREVIGVERALHQQLVTSI